jgi:hypothetical protein
MSERTITKTLSANDTGETGSHQAGLAIPKAERILSFFPTLDSATKNPRAHLRFRDESDNLWMFAFIYYNNRFFGGTRNEYRLTHTTKYIRQSGLTAGDEVHLHWEPSSGYSISYSRGAADEEPIRSDGRTVLSLGSGWKVIDI